MYCDHHHWKVSDEVISKIEGDNYLENKSKHNDYLWFQLSSLSSKEEGYQFELGNKLK